MVIKVVNFGDSGFGSLRAAIEQANANPGFDVIAFAAGLRGTIALVSPLPELAEPVGIQSLPFGQPIQSLPFGRSIPGIQIDFAGRTGLGLGFGSNGFSLIEPSLYGASSASVANPVSFRLGSLFPKRPDGEPNLLLSSSLALKQIDGQSRIVNNPGGEDLLDSPMRISSDPVTISGIDRFLENWFIPQVTATEDKQSLFTKYKKEVLDQWDSTPRNNSITDLLKIGYVGTGSEHSATNSGYWNAYGDKSEQLFKDVSDLANYDPVTLWGGYNGSTLVSSAFDQAALLENIAALENSQATQEPDLS